MGKTQLTQDSDCTDVRTDIRKNCKVTENILKSLQKCYLKENMKLLESHIDGLENNTESATGNGLMSHLKGLRAVLQVLLCQIPTEQGKEVRQSYITFDEAFGLYLAYSEKKTLLTLDIKHEKKRFRELICHPKYGLFVYIVMDKFILLRSDDIDLEFFMEDFYKQFTFESSTAENRLNIDSELLHDMLNSMDSEWDKNIAKVIIGATRSRAELHKLSIDSHNISKLTEEVLDIIQERKNTKIAATDMVRLRLHSKLEKVKGLISSKQKQLDRMKSHWTEHQLDDLNNEIETLNVRKDDLHTIINPTSKSAKKKIGQMIHRTVRRLITENRLGLRRKSSGRPLGMDETDDNFILECIESKSTAHGRRQDLVMYTNRRVKKRDFLQLVNYNRLTRGLKPLKSSTTVYNRARPCNKRSVQSKKHLGMGLFCTKKPPKAEDQSNELTHHQRSHKKML